MIYSSLQSHKSHTYIKQGLLAAAVTVVFMPPCSAQDPLAFPSKPGFSPADNVAGSPQPAFPGQAGPFPIGGKMLEEIELTLPPRDELLPVAPGMPTIRLEATYNQPINLKDVITYAAVHNLAIGIAKETMISQKWLFAGALGRYLPDALMSYSTRFQAGSTLIGGIIPTTFATPVANANAGFRFYGFQGGEIFFNSLSRMHTWKAAKAQMAGTVNDVLFEVAQKYYDVVLQQALLRIQVRAVETSRAQLKLNQQLEAAGTGTYFNVLQADTQLASDEQNLLRQEVTFRTAAIQLARLLNIDLGINLMTVDGRVKKVRLIDPALDINSLMRIAIKYRPELKQFEELRLAARRNIQVAAAPLYPKLNFFGSYTGSGATLGPGYRVAPASVSVRPVSGATVGGTPISLSGAGTGSGANTLVPVAGVVSPAQLAKRQMRSSYQIGIQVDWNYFNLGVPDLANVQSSKALARRALLEANQTFLNVLEQVRTAYLNSLIAEREIDVATRAVASSGEQLRLSRVRLANGVGTNIDVLQAQQAYTTSLSRKAQAIIGFNIAQAKLLRDVGVISVDTVTSGKLLKE